MWASTRRPSSTSCPAARSRAYASPDTYPNPLEHVGRVEVVPVEDPLYRFNPGNRIVVVLDRAHGRHHRVAGELFDRAAELVELAAEVRVIGGSSVCTSSGSICSARAMKPTGRRRRQ
jgi:hypothetical protein